MSDDFGQCQRVLRALDRVRFGETIRLTLEGIPQAVIGTFVDVEDGFIRLVLTTAFNGIAAGQPYAADCEEVVGVSVARGGMTL
jgi:hypothetical protein